MAWKTHRVNDGRLVRRGAALALIGLVLFGASSWYYWQMAWSLELGTWSFGRDINLAFLRIRSAGPATLNLGVLGAIVLFIAGLVGTYYVVYVNVRAADFLIETEAELRKVTWPEYKPWMRADTELWGSTYVVVAVTAALAALIFGWDIALQTIAQFVFYSGPS